MSGNGTRPGGAAVAPPPGREFALTAVLEYDWDPFPIREGERVEYLEVKDEVCRVRIVNGPRAGQITGCRLRARFADTVNRREL